VWGVDARLGVAVLSASLRRSACRTWWIGPGEPDAVTPDEGDCGCYAFILVCMDDLLRLRPTQHPPTSRYQYSDHEADEQDLVQFPAEPAACR